MLDRRKFIAAAGASGALAAAGVGGLADPASAADGPYPGSPQPYFPGDAAAQAQAATTDNAAVGAALRKLGITHVVVAMMENRSFDHLLSWLPGADGRADMVYPGQDGSVYPNYPLGARGPHPDYQGCGYSDQDHSWEGWLVEDADGALDGFLRAPGIEGLAVKAATNTFSIGWYGPEDVPAFAALAQNYTVFDQYFCSFAGETYPNRFYQHSGATDRDHNSGGASPTTLPAIWDQLTPVPGTVGTVVGKVTGAYYFKDVPFLALWGEKYLPFCRPFEGPSTSTAFEGFDNVDKVPTALVNGAVQQTSSSPSVLSGTSFMDAVTAGTLPNVSYIDPSFVVEGSGTSGDWHPLCDVRVGDAFISDIYHALADNGPLGPVAAGGPSYLDSTILIINFDEWGGFFDHVQPPKVTDLTDPNLVSPTGDGKVEGLMKPDYTQCGFRVPCIMVSNRVPAQVVSTVFDHSSVLSLIESIFELQPVVPLQATTPTGGAVGPATRDNFANNIGSVIADNQLPLRTDRPAVLTSTQMALQSRPISGDQTPCSAPTAATSVSPAAIGTQEQYTQYGPATPAGLVTPPGAPTTGLPESPVAIAVPLAAAALAGAAIRRHRSADSASSADLPDSSGV